MTDIYSLKLAQEKLEALNTVLAQINELKNALKRLDLTDVKKLSVSIDEALNNAESIKLAIQTTKEQIDDKQSDITAKFEATNALFNQIQSLQTSLEALKQEAVALNDGFLTAKGDLATQKRELDTRISELAKKIQDFNVNFAVYENLGNSLPTLTQDFNTSRREYEKSKLDYDLKADEVNAKLTQLDTKGESLLRELDTKNADITQGLEQIRNIQSVVSSGFIDDAQTKTNKTYSSSKIADEIIKKNQAVLSSAQDYTTNAINTAKTQIMQEVSRDITDAKVTLFSEHITTKLGKTENAISASKLEYARTINGVAFDGTRNITIADDTKLATATYNSDKATFATKTELNTKLATATYNSEKQTPITNHIIWSIGTTQKEGAVKHFTDFNAVFTEALKYRKATNRDVYIQLHLTSDIVINQQVYVNCCDLSFLRIYGGRTTADNGFKIIAGPNLPANHFLFFFDLGTKAPFFFGITFKGRWLPNNETRPTAAGAGSVNTNGIRVLGGCQALIFDKCKFENLNEAIRCQNASYVYFSNAITEFNMCSIGINAYDLAYVILSTPTFQNCIKALRICSGTQIYCFKCVFKKNNLAIATETNATTTLYLCTLPPNTDAENKNTSDANIAYNTLTQRGTIVIGVV
ncbi:hypothetical protein [Campylobacter gastrosuis]|uniref:Uncharacterized protein n=1 Tax=Campylobacter gastrosuis TaxID=2974576 RepID=A0ABT7HT59_9BACT|nr:hypothetical protein [Campylobacter gastrosuis]MDL0090039.1 hypothetical protein [Campylobacter gastrosuis]